MSNPVRLLSEVSKGDVTTVGGKAASLGEMLQYGLPVPAGLAIGLNAFDGNGKLTQESKQEIGKFITADILFAVRSSALAEDAEGASWAGQFETFLNTRPEDIMDKVEECHNSAKARAKAYASDKAAGNDFDIAVVVQEMIKPEYAGVLFTKDPLSGKDLLVTEYVAGLGEELVSGRADPKKIIISSDEAKQAPFDTIQLAELATKVEQMFGTPQDIEWAWADNKIWLVQARPITATQATRTGYYLGEPDDLFYWGPARAKPMYMSDFMAAVEKFFVNMYRADDLPNPPKAIALFAEGKNVWLINAADFAEFTEKTFEAYRKRNQLGTDYDNWQRLAGRLNELTGVELEEKLVEAWLHTEFAEFSLYGAEAALIKRLNRFDASTRQEIWSAFTVPDKPTFLARIDAKLTELQNPQAMAEKYPWIQDGYDGLSDTSLKYFEDRLKVVGISQTEIQNLENKREELAQKLELTDDEVNSLTLARKLAEFMDERKSWMMQTRRLITRSIGTIEHGWFFNDGNANHISQDDTQELWRRYVDFKASTSAVVGIVASNGGKHFLNGEVVVVNSPTDIVEDDKVVVVPSTSPSYVPLMRKAKALVTDHGGMMSHAAIVAREFNLPCIVGTKQATKVLQNGDKVVLDLVKGEVNR